MGEEEKGGIVEEITDSPSRQSTSSQYPCHEAIFS
jgi:hypothetical protein